ncbi:MAG: FG-GAP-like repeat-containing protein [Myxococcota bacterium]
MGSRLPLVARPAPARACAPVRAASVTSAAVAALAVTIALAPALALASTQTSEGGGGGEGSTQFSGLAQSASANLFTGAMRASIEIPVPPGRADATPQLALVYSSDAGSGSFGHGWTLPLGSISRSTRAGVPRCRGDVATAAFALSLPGASVELVWIESEGLFRAETDEGYLEAYADVVANRWVVHDLAGNRLTFGDVPSARVFRTADAFLDESACAFTTTWALTELRAPSGSTIEVHYAKDGDVLHPSEILYGGSRDDAGALVVEHAFRVAFRTAPRPRARTSARRGVVETLALEVDAIDVEYRPDAASGFAPVRTLELGYASSPAAGHRLLVSVAQEGRPTRTFDYATDDLRFGELATFAPPDVPGEGEGYFRDWADGRKVTRSVMDMNGDGRLDLVDTNSSSAWNVYPGLAGGGFAATPIAWDVSATDPAWVDSMQRTTNGDVAKFQLDTLDLTGDGLPDWVDARGDGAWAVYPGVCTGPATCGFGAPIAWPAPEKHLRQSIPARTAKDLIDLDADGRVDLVVAAGGGPWAVYWNDGAGFATEPDPTFVADGYLHRSAAEANPASLVERAVFDMNGDGVPDLVESPADELAAVDAAGAILGFVAEAPGCELHHTTGSSDTSACVGPPGAVAFTGFLSVRVGDGHGFAAQPVYSVLQTQGVRLSSLNRTRIDFADVNGDGLPDYLLTTPFSSVGGNDPWRVALNRGDGTLEPPQIVPGAGAPDDVVFPRTWLAPSGAPATNYARRGTATSNATRTHLDLLDWDGDGLLDRVDASDAQTWQVELARAVDGAHDARPLQLVHMDDGARGETFVRYAPTTLGEHADAAGVPSLPFVRWVVAGIRSTSGLCDGPAPSAGVDAFDPVVNACIEAGHERVRRFAYEGGAFDAASRELRGFRRVVELAPDASRTETTFHQGDALRGRVELVETFPRASAEPVRRVENVWQTRTSSLDARRTQVFLAETRTSDLALPNAAGPPRCLASRNEPPDDFGRVARTCSFDCALASGPPASCADAIEGKVETLTAWAEPDGASPRRVRDRPARVETRWVPEAGAASVLLARKHFTYDALPSGAVDRGWLTQTRDELDRSFAGGAGDPVVTTSYDAVGNVVAQRTRDANAPSGAGELTTFAYDDAFFRLYATRRTLPDAGTAANTVEIETDLRFGEPVRTVDANGQVSARVYDAHGRLVCQAGPLEDIGGCGTGSFTHGLEVEYVDAVAGAGASFAERHARVVTRTRGGQGAIVRAVAYRDALGRERFREIEQVVGGKAAPLVAVVRDQVVYDASGRVVASYGPYVGPVVDPGVASPPVAPTVTDYALGGAQAGGAPVLDPLARPFRIAAPDGNATTFHYEGRVTRTLDALGNEATSIADAFGNEVRRELRDQGVLVQEVDTRYDGARRVLATTLAGDASTTVTRVYDTLGNLVELDDPDSGLWRYAYDHRGNLVYEDSPRPAMHVQATYDAQSRRRLRCTYAGDEWVATSEGDCGAGGVVESSLAYDEGPFGVGRRTSAVDASGSETLVWDARGRLAVRTKVVAGIAATLAYTYDAGDRIATTTYPDGEVVAHGYDAAGAPVSLASDDGTVYLEDVEHDALGRAVRLVRGNGAVDALEFLPSAQGDRLASLRVDDAGGEALLDLSYEWGARGKLAAISDHRDAGTPRSQSATFGYDGVGRLVAYDWDDAATTAALDHDTAYAYGAKGNLVARGDDAFAYGEDGAGPHQLTSAGASSLLYLEDGSRRLRIDWNGFPFAPAGRWQLCAYDALGRLVTVAMGEGNGGAAIVVRHAYDHEGVRVAKTFDRKHVYRYFDRRAEADGGRLVKSYWAGEMRIAVREVDAIAFSETPGGGIQRDVYRLPPVGVASLGAAVAALLAAGAARPRAGRRGAPRAVGACVLAAVASTPIALLVARPAEALPLDRLRHVHVDHLGSTQAVTDADGLLVLQVRYRPYGAVRGRWDASGNEVWQPAALQREFAGHETEMFSGLVDAGLRHYDPDLAQFLTLDPVRQFASPYAYGAGDPLAGVDPTGGCFLGIDCALVATLGKVLLAVSAALVVARAVQVGIQTGSVGAAVEALATDGAALIAGVTLVGGLIAQLADTVQVLVGLGAAGYSGYEAAESARSGDVIGALSASLGVVAAAAGATLAAGRAARAAAPPPDVPQVIEVNDGSGEARPTGDVSSSGSTVPPVSGPPPMQAPARAPRAGGLAAAIEAAARYADDAARAFLTARLRSEQHQHWLELQRSASSVGGPKVWAFEVFRIRTFPATGQTAIVDAFNVFVTAPASAAAGDVRFPGVVASGDAATRFDTFDVRGPYRLPR